MLRWAVIFLVIALVAAALWVYRNCLGGGGNCEISLFPVPGCLPGALYRRNEHGEKVLAPVDLTRFGQNRNTDLRSVRHTGHDLCSRRIPSMG